MVSPSNGQRYCLFQAETVSSKTAKLNCPGQLRMRWIDQGYDISITNIDERMKKIVQRHLSKLSRIVEIS
jgi:hypothetical protein